MKANLWKKIILILIIIILGALCLEGATRFFLPDKTPDPVVPAYIGQFDDKLGWALKPNSQANSDRLGYRINYRINSKGLRDEENSYKKPGEKFRIVLLGDSRTFGYGVPIKKHFSTLLEGYFKNVDVINMGITGFGVDQELLFLRYEGFRYEPDLVIAYVAHYADHRHMYTRRFGKLKPRFELIDEKLILTNSPVPKEDESLLPSGFIRNTHRWLFRYSEAYGIFISTFSGLFKRSQNQPAVSHNQLITPNETFINQLNELGEEIIFEMHNESLKNGATFVLVTQLDKLHKAAIEKKILSLDISKSLDNPKYLLPENLAHVNESGNGVIAWEIAKFLQTSKLIPLKHINKQVP